MRNISFLFLLSVLGIVGCQSSKTSKPNNPIPQTNSKQATSRNASYKPFAEFRGDTLQYLNYNFVDHKEQYIGKTFSVLYNDLEFPVKSCSSVSDNNNQLVSSSITLSFYDDETTSYRMNSDNLPSYFLIVKWEKPITSESLSKVDKENNDRWTPSHEVLLNGQIIKEVAVLKYIDPQSKKQ